MSSLARASSLFMGVAFLKHLGQPAELGVGPQLGRRSVNRHTDAQLADVDVQDRKLVIERRQAYVLANADVPASAQHKTSPDVSDTGEAHIPEPDTGIDEKAERLRWIHSQSRVECARTERQAVNGLRKSGCTYAKEHMLVDRSAQREPSAPADITLPITVLATDRSNPQAHVEEESLPSRQGSSRVWRQITFTSVASWCIIFKLICRD